MLRLCVFEIELKQSQNPCIFLCRKSNPLGERSRYSFDERARQDEQMERIF